ncbi:Crp/Fnr family transcriptional regulator [Carnobacterium maltaromaticum]|uniref:Crp/Fnr family transcriptional regulator n=1 Tax=Carnobacterium maltaromaticum TaxID=2751 RepID=UPI00107278F1|nr:Crp/Fnr family transcriptional regulator [Carnobacterium maltaromaticum]TFJ72860.1 cyclic nucleotide-binding protein [Carnobacterium maltaromaticum]TFJ77637.1 cyclic nucleotide-binding protein [Carnobacterium maltaromaticum]
MEHFKNNRSMIDYLNSFESSTLNCQQLTLTQDEYIITRYEKSEYLYLLTNGLVSVEILEDSNNYISAFIFENDFFGLDSFSSFPTKNHAIKVISSSAEIVKIKKDFLLNALNQKPELYKLLLTNFADIFQRHYYFFNFLSLPPVERVKTTLLYLSDFISEPTETNHLKIPKEITQQIVARFCRTSQSRVSICLKKLHETGFLLTKTAPFIIT